MVSLKWSHGCGFYCIVFIAILLVGLSFPEDSVEYNHSISVGAAWILLFIPFLCIWGILVRKTQSPNQMLPPHHAAQPPYYGGSGQHYAPQPQEPVAFSYGARPPFETIRPSSDSLFLPKQPLPEQNEKPEKICPLCGAPQNLGLKYCEMCGHFL
jgi:hypothetical protein